MAVSQGRVQNENPFMESMKTAGAGLSQAMKIMQANKQLNIMQQDADREKLKLGIEYHMDLFDGLETDYGTAKALSLTRKVSGHYMEMLGVGKAKVTELFDNIDKLPKTAKVIQEEAFALALTNPASVGGLVDKQYKDIAEAAKVAELGGAPAPGMVPDKVERVQVGEEEVTREVSKPVEQTVMPGQDPEWVAARSQFVEREIYETIVKPGLKPSVEGRLLPSDLKPTERIPFVREQVREKLRRFAVAGTYGFTHEDIPRILDEIMAKVPEWTEKTGPEKLTRKVYELGSTPRKGGVPVTIQTMTTETITEKKPIYEEVVRTWKADKSNIAEVIPVGEEITPTDVGLAQAVTASFHPEKPLPTALVGKVMDNLRVKDTMTLEQSSIIVRNMGGWERFRDGMNVDLLNAETNVKLAGLQEKEFDMLKKKSITWNNLPPGMLSNGKTSLTLNGVEAKAFLPYLSAMFGGMMAGGGAGTGLGENSLFKEAYKGSMERISEAYSKANEKLGRHALFGIINWKGERAFKRELDAQFTSDLLKADVANMCLGMINFYGMDMGQQDFADLIIKGDGWDILYNFMNRGFGIGATATPEEVQKAAAAVARLRGEGG